MGTWWEQIIELFQLHQSDPLTYLVIFFILCVAAAIFLPIPIEIFLLINPAVFFPLKAIAMGLGKGAGALAVYYIGHEIDNVAHNVARRKWLKRLFKKAKTAGKRSPLWTVFVAGPYFRSHRKKLVKMVKDRRQTEGSAGWGWMKWLMRVSEKLIRKYGYSAVFVIMMIPGMIDTIPLYIFSILNKETGGTLMTERGFVLVNIAAGITRAAIVWLIFYAFGIPIFSPPEVGV